MILRLDQRLAHGVRSYSIPLRSQLPRCWHPPAPVNGQPGLVLAPAPGLELEPELVPGRGHARLEPGRGRGQPGPELVLVPVLELELELELGLGPAPTRVKTPCYCGCCWRHWGYDQELGSNRWLLVSAWLHFL